MNKKIIGILISITLILTVLPVSGIIDYDGYYWNGNIEKNQTPSTNSLTNSENSYGLTERNNSPPYQPNNPNPANGSINVSIDIDLNWTGGDPDGNNVTYVVYFGNNSTPPMVSDNQTNVTYDPGIMDFNITYYWQIIAWDNQSEFNISPMWEFITIQEDIPNQPPYEPSDPIPQNGEINVSIGTDLGWTGGDPDGDNVTYDVYFGTNITPDLVSNNQTQTTYDPSILEYNTTYYWYVVAWDNQSAFNISTMWEFLTIQEGFPNQPPYEPSDPIPQNGEINVSIGTDLGWTGGDPDGDNVTYDVYFGTNTTPDLVSNNQTETTYDPGILIGNVTYYWQIIAKDEYNLSNQSDLWNFTTKFNTPPNQPFNESPSNTSTSVIISVDLSWECSDDDNDTITYDVYFGNFTPPPKVEANYTETTYDPGILSTEETYYWQIIAWDEFGAYNKGPIWWFITQSDSPPYPPDIIAGPSVGGPGIELNFTAITSDPEGDDVYYQWDWGDGNFSDWIGPYDVSQPIKIGYSWNNSGDYVIRVKARDIHGKEGDWSDNYNISIFKQITINNLKPGYVYFHILTFTGSYLFLQAFEFLGICGVLSTGKMLIINASVSAHVDSVKFECLQILWNLTTEEWDNDMSDGCDVIMSIAAGLYQLKASAYDEDGNLIDQDMVPYLIYFCRSKSGGGGQLRTAIANRLSK